MKDVCMDDLANKKQSIMYLREGFVGGNWFIQTYSNRFETWWTGPRDSEVSVRLTTKGLENCIKWTLYIFGVHTVD